MRVEPAGSQPWDRTYSAEFGEIHYDGRSEFELGVIFKEIFEVEDYAQHGLEYRPGSIIIDVGANIGLFAIYALQRCRGDAQILAVEPAPVTFRYLTLNARAHGLLDAGAELLPVALGPTGGPSEAKLTFFPGLPGNSTLFADEKKRQMEAYVDATLEKLKREDRLAYMLSQATTRRRFQALTQGEEVLVSLTPLAEVIASRGLPRVDLLKVDTEGAELDVLNGLDEASWPLVRQVVLEANSTELKNEIVDRLERRGFEAVHVHQTDWAVEFGLDAFQITAIR